MKKTDRILKSREFARIIHNKQSRANASFVIYYAKPHENHPRVGISVSKKLGKAHQRNKIKRQVRMMFQSLLKQGLNNDIICIVRAGYNEQTFATNFELLTTLIQQIQAS